MNYGSAGFDDWREVESDHTVALTDASVGELSEQALGIEPARWSRAGQMRVSAYLKAGGWIRYRKRDGAGREAGREWRHRKILGGA